MIFNYVVDGSIKSIIYDLKVAIKYSLMGTRILVR